MFNSLVIEDQTKLPTELGVGRQDLATRKEYVERAIPLLVFVISLLYLFLFRHYSAMDPDEGIVLQGAERVLRGEVPYRDFFSFYTPGSFYLVAGLFRLFGDSFAVARTGVAFLGAGLSVLTYLLARRACSRKMALMAAGLTMTTGPAYRFLVIHNWYASLFTCLSLYAAIRLLESGAAGWGLATGSFAALATLIEQSTGAGLCIGLAAGFVILRYCGNFKVWKAKTVALGFAWPWIIVVVYFGLNGALGAMFRDWLWPLHHYTSANHVFYGYQSWPSNADEILHSSAWWLRIGKYLALSPGVVVPLVALSTLAWLAYWTGRLASESFESRHRYYVLASSTLVGLLSMVCVVRPDIIHLMYLNPLWYVVLAWTLQTDKSRANLLRRLSPCLTTYVCVAFGLMGFALLLTVNGATNRIYTRRGRVRVRAEDTVAAYIQRHVAPGDAFLVYPYLPLYNYLTETHSPARLDYFQAGMNTPAQAQEIIESLKSKRVHAVLFEPEFGAKFSTSWPETPLGAIANDTVADFIIRNYRVCAPLMAASGWRFQFMVRKGEPCE